MALQGIELAGSVLIGTTKPVDVKYGPFNAASYAAAVTLANTEIASTIRYKGLTVGLSENNGEIKEYWYKDGVADGDLVEKTSGSGGSSTMQDVYDASGGPGVSIVGEDYTKNLLLINQKFSFATNDQTNTPTQATVPRTQINSFTTTNNKEITIESFTDGDSDKQTGRGRIYLNSENASGEDTYLDAHGKIYIQTLGLDTKPETPVSLDPVVTRNSGSGIAMSGWGGEENPGTIRFSVQNQFIPGTAPTSYNEGWVEIVSPYQGNQQGEENSFFSIGTQRLYLNDSVKCTNFLTGPVDGDILQVKTALDANGDRVNWMELQSITPQKFNLNVERDKSPTCYLDTQSATVTLNISGVKNGQYGTIYIKHPNGFNITLGTVNGNAVTHQVVNGQNGTLPTGGSVSAEELIVDVYTYLWIEKDDTTVTNYDLCVWNYGLNYT